MQNGDRSPRFAWRQINAGLLLRNQFHATVLEASFFRFIVGNGLRLAIPLRRQALSGNTLANQILANGIGTVLRQGHVVGVAAAAIGMACHFHLDIAPCLQALCSLIEGSGGFGAQDRHIVVEIHPIQGQRRDRRATIVGFSEYGRAHVLAIHDAVAIAIQFASVCIDLLACRRGRALVLAIGYAITVIIAINRLRVRGAGAAAAGAGAAAGTGQPASSKALPGQPMVL